MKTKTFMLSIKCAGDVAAKHNLDRLNFNFGLDGKLHITDEDNKPVPFEIGSTVTRPIPLKRSLGRARRLSEIQGLDRIENSDTLKP